MKEGGRGNSSRLVNGITRVLVVGQIALTAALLIAAALQVKSIRNQTQLDYGYDEYAIYSARMGLMDGDYLDLGCAPAILPAHFSARCAAIRPLKMPVQRLAIASA